MAMNKTIHRKEHKRKDGVFILSNHSLIWYKYTFSKMIGKQ
jgi:hypothetical protein